MPQGNPRRSSHRRQLFELLRYEDPNGVSLPGLPGRHEHHRFAGHVYVIELSNGTIKVGRTTNPLKRMKQHAKQAGPFELKIVRVWLSIAHRDPDKVEKLLLGYAWEHSTGRIFEEYFKGLDFEAVIRFARGVPYKPLDKNEIADLLRIGREKPGPFGHVDMQEPKPPAQPEIAGADLADALHDIIGQFMGRRSDGSYVVPTPGIDMEDSDLPIEILERLEELAELRGVPLQSLLEMSWIDVRAAAIYELVKSEVERFRHYADSAGHTHVTEPVGSYLFRCIDERNTIWAAQASTSR